MNEDEIENLKAENEQLKADSERLLKEIADWRLKVETHRSAVGVQERHRDRFRDRASREKQRAENVRALAAEALTIEDLPTLRKKLEEIAASLKPLPAPNG